MTLELESLGILREALECLESSFDTLPEFNPDVDLPAVRAVILEVAERMQDNFPYPHPLYAGQMLTPPHTVARLAYMLSMWVNPNNHALDGGRASSAMEKEAVAELARMFGWGTHLGHLCGGGTMANLEALWVANRLAPGKKIAASQQAHYTHQRLSEVLGLPFVAVPCDQRARMDLDALETLLQTGEIGTVVATMGTTATGSVDPLAGLLELQAKYKFRIHADAAYGGFFTLASTLDAEARRAFDALGRVDSIAIDPHKHGLQPYGCGCILFKDPAVGALYQHHSPYTYFTSAALHLGEISLECSRPGASAVALWATQRLYPLVKGGAFAAGLDKSLSAAKVLFQNLQADPRCRTAFNPELDIVIWSPRGDSASQVSQLTREVFERAATENLHLAIANLPASLLKPSWPELIWDQDYVSCLRSCLLKPEHLDWMPQLWGLLDKALNKIQISQ